MPSYFDDAKKRRIEDKRIAYKATTAAAMTITAGELCADVEEMIREDESFLDAMQRLGHEIGGCVILVMVLVLERASSGMLYRAHASLNILRRATMPAVI